MKDLEPNKIFAALLVAGITISFAGFIAEKATGHHVLKENAYKIEGVASSAGGAPVAEDKAQPILDMIASADAAKGQQTAKVCASCHNFEKGGPNSLGPNLYGVVGRAKGSHAGYDYSEGMKKMHGEWGYEDLNKFLYKPKHFVEGTKMTFIGMKKPEDRAAVIAWLRTLADAPVAEPTAAQIATEKADLAPAEPAEGAKDPKAVTAPSTAEQGALDGKGKPDAKALDATDATAAVPEGNGGTGAPQSNPDVNHGSKPVEGSAKTPQEKLNDKLGGKFEPTQDESNVPADQKKLRADKKPHVLPADTRSVDESSGTKRDQDRNSDIGQDGPTKGGASHPDDLKIRDAE